MTLAKARKPVVCWMVSLENGADWCGCVDRSAALTIARNARSVDPTAKAVRVVEASPARDAVVRAAIAFDRHSCVGLRMKLFDAVSRLQRKVRK